MAAFPEASTAATWTTIVEIRTFTGCADAVWLALETLIGALNDEIRVLATLPGCVIHAAISAARIPIQGNGEPRHMNPVEAAQAGLVWRISRRLAWVAAGRIWLDYPDEEVAASTTSSLLPNAAVSSAALAIAAPVSTSTARKIKASLVIDQTDESEITPSDPGVIEQWHANYTRLKSATCPHECEPSDDQLTGLDYRVRTAKRTPYVDLAIWGPFGRKTYKRNRLRTWLPDGKGGYTAHEIPGPENFAVWIVGWRVFTAAALMLQIVSSAALEAYERRIERLVKLWGDAWHLIYQADDWMRAEMIEKVRREQQADVSAGHPVPKCWSPSEPWHPWSAAFLAAASDNTFWDDQVVHPATAWRSSGKRGALRTQEEEMLGIGGSQGGKAPQSEQATSHRNDSSSRNRSRTSRMQKLRSENDRLKSSPQASHSSGSKGGGKNQKGESGGKSKGQQACWSFSKSFGQCKDAAPGSHCPTGRKHACHKCDGNHNAAACHLQD